MYKLQLIRDEKEKEVVIGTWSIPEIIKKKSGAIKVKFLPSLTIIKKAIKEDMY